MSDRPARLTFPSVDIGLAWIIADGRHQVGFALAEFRGWRARLWPAPDIRPARMQDCEEVTGKTLAELRETLRKRVADGGPWWTD
jgi:hypothetical protein